MSNYIFGFFQAEDEKAVVNIVETMREHFVVGFHIVEADTIPDVPGFPKSDDLVYFILSDSDDVLYSEVLMLEMDWAEGCSGKLPSKLTDRITLIVNAVTVIAELSHSATVGLWLSEVDQLEGVVAVRLASLFDRMTSDFESRGIPCLLYKVVPLMVVWLHLCLAR